MNTDNRDDSQKLFGKSVLSVEIKEETGKMWFGYSFAAKHLKIPLVLAATTYYNLLMNSEGIQRKTCFNYCKNKITPSKCWRKLIFRRATKCSWKSHTRYNVTIIFFSITVLKKTTKISSFTKWKQINFIFLIFKSLQIFRLEIETEVSLQNQTIDFQLSDATIFSYCRKSCKSRFYVFHFFHLWDTRIDISVNIFVYEYVFIYYLYARMYRTMYG